MADIVATIQAEQDDAIRADAAGILVVQGGPGTGKTAVALHRAAYLLYTHRDRLERSGVLLVGPSPVFLRYISRVLPSLGETGVVTTTVGGLVPGVEATDRDPAAVAAVKGSHRMVSVLRTAVRDRQRVPQRAISLEVEGRTLVLRPDDVAAARSAARRTRRPHNVARGVFVRELLARLRRQYAGVLGMDDDSLDHQALEEDLRESRDVRREVNLAWMPLTPQQVLADLYADPARLESAGVRLRPDERALLARPRGEPWTVDDVALLDELGALLGDDDEAERARARAEAVHRDEQRRYAAEALRSMGGAAAGMVSADLLAERFTDAGPARTVAERAATDPTWAYGHVVVDEAQELTPMMWRALHRRCPSRSMTVVGDVAQTSHPAGAGTWAAALDPWARGAWRTADLTVNYRTPARIMDVAAAVLAAHEPVAPDVPRSVREGDHAPRAIRVDDLDQVAGVVARAAAATAPGRTAVVTSPLDHGAVARAVVAALPGESGSGPGSLDLPVAVLTTDQVKGLEFDTVVVVEPADILGQSPRGAHDLYVALTRPTQRLVVTHRRPLPTGLDGLVEQA
jgi:DNA helicase IV